RVMGLANCRRNILSPVSPRFVEPRLARCCARRFWASSVASPCGPVCNCASASWARTAQKVSSDADVFSRFCAILWLYSGENRADRFRAFDTDDFLVETGIEVGQAVRVETQAVQYGGME